MQLTHFIHGQWQAGEGSTWQTYDPCTGTRAWQGQEANLMQLEQAIQTAQYGFDHWSRQTFDTRVKVLKQFATLLTEDADAMATTIALETGKPYWEAKQEVAAMVNKIDLSIRAHQARCENIEEKQADSRLALHHKPHGVMAVLGPYNFPGHLPHGHIVPALLAGNTVIFKPSELTPQTAKAMTKLWQASGLPQGVLNLIQGDGRLGQALATHPQVKGVLFTGSYATGQALHQALAGQVSKLLVLEMGGNNPLIVWDEPLLAETVANILVSAFITTGQRCTCARRLILPAGQAYTEALLAALIAGTQALSRGKPMATPNAFMGPLISAQAKNKVLASLNAWQALGIKPLLAVETEQDHTGWISPGIYVDDGNRLPDAEIFGPVLVVQYAKNFEDALTLANHTAYGLSAGLLSPNRDSWRQFTETSHAGVLAWNKPLTGASSRLPFGGTGHSGNMRPSAWYAADYAAYPVASQSTTALGFPSNIPQGLLP